MTTRICFIRHGETDWNAGKRIQGQIDIPLNAVGQAQASEMARRSARYRLDAIYSSDLQRAVETAQQLAVRHTLPIRQLAQLRERHFGILQGMTAPEAALQYPEAHRRHKARDLHYDFGHGESLSEFAGRIESAMALIVGQHGGQTIAAVCHAGVLDILYRKATLRSLHTPRDFAIPNCALNWFRCDDQGWHLESWGEMMEGRMELAFDVG